MSDDKSKVSLMHPALLMKGKVQAGVFMALQSVHADTFGKRYRHYKGTIYWVLGSGVDTATDTKVIIYMNRLGQLATRPCAEFFGFVDTDNTQKRFTLLED